MPVDSASKPSSNTQTSYKSIALACLALAFILAILTPRYESLQNYAGTLLTNSGNMHFQNPFKGGDSSKSSTVDSKLPRPSGKVNAVYFTNWAIYGRKFRPQDIPVEHVTREFEQVSMLLWT